MSLTDACFQRYLKESKNISALSGPFARWLVGVCGEKGLRKQEISLSFTIALGSYLLPKVEFAFGVVMYGSEAVISVVELYKEL